MLRTVAGYHTLPLRLKIPLRLRQSQIPRRVRTPADLISSITCQTLAANSALAVLFATTIAATAFSGLWGDKFGALGFRGGHSQTRALGNQFPLPLREQRQNPHGELVGIRALTANEVNATVLKAEKELCFAGESILFCDNDRCLGSLRVLQRPFARIIPCRSN
jgi:hypothetical protein